MNKFVLASLGLLPWANSRPDDGVGPKILHPCYKLAGLDDQVRLHHPYCSTRAGEMVPTDLAGPDIEQCGPNGYLKGNQIVKLDPNAWPGDPSPLSHACTGLGAYPGNVEAENHWLNLKKKMREKDKKDSQEVLEEVLEEALEEAVKRIEDEELDKYLKKIADKHDEYYDYNKYGGYKHRTQKKKKQKKTKKKKKSKNKKRKIKKLKRKKKDKKTKKKKKIKKSKKK